MTVMTDEVPLLHLEHISKRFGANLALDDVALDVRRGEVLALIGQNGSGKSTLIKILTGFQAPEDGARVRVDGVEAAIGASAVESVPGASESRSVPIRAVHQDAALVPGLSAIDNIALTAGYVRRRSGSVDWRKQRELTRAALEMVQAADIDIHASVEELDVVHRAQIAIARALVGWDVSGGLLLLDEPTSAMSDGEANRLFEVLADLKRRSLSVLYVSHRLDEVLRIADRVTIIRDGRLVATEPTSDLHYDKLVSLMVGTAVESLDAASEVLDDVAPSATERSLVVRHLVTSVVRDLSFEVAPGEILGITGLAGAGHEHVAHALVGEDPALAGRLEVEGATLDLPALSPRAALRAGVALVPGDRQQSGLIDGFPISDNISLPRIGRFMRRGWLSRHREMADARSWMASLRVQPAEPSYVINDLSGGNQQKVVIAKCLSVAHAALVLSDPTAGVDVGARAAIYRRFLSEAANGLPIVVSSSDPDDMIHLCNRVIVLSGGAVVAELAGDEITKERILHAAGRTGD